MSRLFSYLLQVAIRIVAQVMTSNLQLVNQLESDVYQSIRTDTDSLIQTGRWQGRGADGFAQEMEQEFYPRLENLIQSLYVFNQKITIAQDIVVNGEQQTRQLISDLQDTYQQL